MKSLALALLLGTLLLSGCALHPVVQRHYPLIWGDEDRLDALGYTGPHRAVYIIGSDRCYTGDDTKPFPQADLKCF